MADIDIEALKQAAPIIPYVKKYYPNVVIVTETEHVCHALCVFHQEKTGSLAFFSNGTYKCFGECGESGDLIKFVMYMENMDFLEACKLIGDNVGYPVVLTPPNPFHEQYKDNMDNHNRRYWGNLQQNEIALNYLTSVRHLTQETIDYFRLGLTDPQEYKYRTDLGGISNRIVFPILEAKSTGAKCIAMGYRDYTGSSDVKYINDPNQDGRDNQDPNVTGVFIKGNILYGYPMAYQSIKQNGYAILVEGYMDVVSLHQASVSNALGSMGTSLTENQVILLRKITRNVILLMDGDQPGTESMLRSLPLLYKHGMTVSICNLTGGMDPADLCVKYNFNCNAVRNEIKRLTRSAINVFIDNAVYSYEQAVTRERIRAINASRELIESLPNDMDRDLFTKMLYKRLDI